MAYEIVFDAINGRITYRYAGRAQHNMLKNKMTRHESRKPRPNAVGPKVPAERLAAHVCRFQRPVIE